MEKRKLTKADIDKVRNIEGFPIAKDEDIIALSDAPYYTACPNPFIEDFIRENGKPYDEATDDYHREPFAADVSEGKNEPIYNAHSYHTKVPHKAIMRYILHYTKPGDIVFDGFCGTGMTGVAAQLCGNPEPIFKMQIEQEMKDVQWGPRKAILTDLSPAATFIAYNYNTPVDVSAFRKEADRILAEVKRECEWMYETSHITNEKNQQIAFGHNGQKGRLNYTIWSDVFICPTCSKELVFWEVAVDKESGKVTDVFSCPHCGSELKKTDCSRAQETHVDNKLGDTVRMAKQVPVLINYTWGKKRYDKRPDENDIALYEKIATMAMPYWYPTDRMCEGSESRRNDRYGITRVHQFYTRRALYVFATFKHYASNSKALWLLTSTTEGSSKLNRERPNGLPSKLSGTLYISSMIREIDVISFIERKITKFVSSVKDICSDNIIGTQSCTDVTNVEASSIDYIFTDPAGNYGLTA